ncbi:TPA: hypothetical protein EYP13_00425 [Candidatus Micrarchaeota archaeon]|nr:hypothetical protein [Candidatus Micrarchaeota archaeon]
MIGIAIVALLASIIAISVAYTFAGFPLYYSFYTLVKSTNFAYKEDLLNFYDVVVSCAVISGIISIIGLFIWVIAYISRREKYDFLFWR